jgi:hypothetical protein
MTVGGEACVHVVLLAIPPFPFELRVCSCSFDVYLLGPEVRAATSVFPLCFCPVSRGVIDAE